MRFIPIIISIWLVIFALILTGIQLLMHSLSSSNQIIAYYSTNHTPQVASITDYQAIDTVFTKDQPTRVASESTPTSGQIVQKPSPSPQAEFNQSPTPISEPTSNPPSYDQDQDKPKIENLYTSPIASPPPEPIPTPSTSTTHPKTTSLNPFIQSTPSSPQINDSNLVSAINDYRLKHGKGELIPDNDLCDFANIRSKEIVNNFSHQGFEDHIKNGAVDHLQYSSIAENIWQGNPFSIDRVIDGWHNSSSHKKAMLDDWVFGCGAILNNHAVFLFMNR